jgi:hypothetical protein
VIEDAGTTDDEREAGQERQLSWRAEAVGLAVVDV